MKHIESYLGQWCEPHPKLAEQFDKFINALDTDKVIGWSGILKKFAEHLGGELLDSGNSYEDQAVVDFDKDFAWDYWTVGDKDDGYVAIRIQEYPQAGPFRGYGFYQFYYASWEFIEFLYREDYK